MYTYKRVYTWVSMYVIIYKLMRPRWDIPTSKVPKTMDHIPLALGPKGIILGTLEVQVLATTRYSVRSCPQVNAQLRAPNHGKSPGSHQLEDHGAGRLASSLSSNAKQFGNA